MLQPAEIDIKSKNIAVLAFKNDRYINLASLIETQLTNSRFKHKSYFNVVNRREFKNVIKEQKLQYSGLLNERTAVEVGDLIGAESLISGEISSLSKTDQHYKEKRYCTKEQSCQTYEVHCIKRIIRLSVNIRITNVTLGTIPYSKTIYDNGIWNKCSDHHTKSLPTKERGGQMIAQDIAKAFTQQLIPRYIHRNVTLLENPDIEYTDTEKKLLSNSLTFTQQGRLDKAEQLLMTLLNSTHSQSYVAAYNLGVIKEAQGKLKHAKDYYLLADSLQIEPVEEINLAVNRIKHSIIKTQTANQQLRRNLSQ